jgi:hypothetical protein
MQGEPAMFGGAVREEVDQPGVPKASGQNALAPIFNHLGELPSVME